MAPPLRVGTEVQRLGAVVAIAALVIVVINVGRLSYSALVTVPAGDDLRAGLLALEDSQDAVMGTDSLLRGYLATRDPYFVAQAATRAPEIGAAEGAMLATLDTPSVFPRVLELVTTQREWQAGWVGRIQTVPAERIPEFVAQGDQLMRDYRAASTATRTALLEDIRSQDSAVRVLQRSLIVVTALVAIAALVVALRARRRLLSHVVAPVDGLLAAVRGISEGRLTPPEPVEGSAELVALRDGITDMTVALRKERDETAAQAERLQVRTERLRTILIMTREIAGSLNTRYVVDATVQAAVAVTDGRVLLWLVLDDGSALELAHDSDRGSVSPMEEDCPLAVGVVGRSARYGQISRGDPEAGEDPAVAVPMVVGARVIGVVECYPSPDGEVDGQRLSSVEMLATLAGSAIEASRLHAATERLSEFDPLTQLANRRRLGVDLDRAVADAKRWSVPMSVIILDLDHFKELNDRYGHQQGDVVLQEVAAVLRSALRDGETPYRWGGEEFAVLVPTHGPDEATTLAERLRVRVEEDFRRGDKQLLTASFGVAGLPEHAGDGEALLSEADRALYAAKNAGRNRVHRAG
ncbi:diguanylate cyclase (GGDEF)-like protein [Actinomycetospora succinea]|uniref:Diguanylate cyclase (GGDEF)-like protein n=1 Tax=Actinomycetospora succinea TaxID=663603 RepID=A0A4R6UV47_9PSEU|nr:sensor domain-containing diguanylate cyclase [Actinomycetospora succinea]TDQ50136.1 diguanylate cyclase (GGDEF)-like protein [Actinomycetospora succinea]